MNADSLSGGVPRGEPSGELHAGFEQSAHPMLLVDDLRRWLTGNAAACNLLGVVRDEVPWYTMDDLTPLGERGRLEERWEEFLVSGVMDGSFLLHVPDRGHVPVKIRLTANVLPARHLAVFVPPGTISTLQPQTGISPAPVPPPAAAEGHGRLRLTEREREVMTLVASGLQSGEIAKRLFLSFETVKSHVHNAMGKLGSHTRAHAVAVALVTGQITWDGLRAPTGASADRPHPN